MSDKNMKLRLVAAFLWLVIAVVLAVAAKFFVLPHFQEELAEETGSSSRYEYELTVAADSFSGYSILRSPAMRKAQAKRGSKLIIKDDGAAYGDRIQALEDGDVDLAVFTIDSFLSAGVKHGSFPGTIVLVIDETKGADAIVGYEQSMDSLESLDDAEARLVLTPQSPSEFLARTVIAHFSLPNLPEVWWEAAEGAKDVYEKFKATDPSAKRAFVLWEPYVTKALQLKGAKLLLDSSKLEGYIVDVLVVGRTYLKDHPDRVKHLVEDYLRAGFSYDRKKGGLEKLVLQDSKEMGGKLTDDQAEKLVAGVEWKNTLENLAYFGLLPEDQSRGKEHIEDMITKIAGVLVQTGALKEDTISDVAHTLFYDKVLDELKAEGFHPGKKVNIIKGMGGKIEDAMEVRKEPDLRGLTEDEWGQLIPVGTLRIKPINFGRGTARINIQSTRELDALAKKLKSLPQYYLTVVGHTRSEGDPEANRKLAESRAEAARKHLSDAGVRDERLRAVAAPSKGDGGASQSVSFVVGQRPY